MKHLVLLSVALLSFCYAASASTACVDGTLASYEALGTSGCTIGTNVLSSFQTLSGIYGATPIDPATLMLMPIGTDSDPGIMLTANVMVNSGPLDEAIFTYSIAGDSYSAVNSTVSGTASSGNGAVTFIQNNCADGAFGPDGVSGCTGTAGSSLVLGDGSDGGTFSPSASLVTVTDDFTIDSGGTGSASGGTFSDQFTASPAISGVPEPSTYLLTAIGLAFAASRKAWFRNQHSREEKV